MGHHKGIARITAALILALLMAAAVQVAPAYADTLQAECEGIGANWVGSSPITGQCQFYPGATFHFAAYCDADIHDYFYDTYVNDADVDSGCHVIGTPSYSVSGAGGGGGNGGGNHVINESGEETTTLSLGGGKNGSVTFAAGTCGQKCVISPSLPAGASGSLPSDAIATLYVRVVDADGNPGSGGYTVCFANEDGEALTIYRYVNGAWTATQIASSNPICVSASGDGAFYLA